MVEIGISLYWISASWLFIYRLFSVAPMDFLICNRIFPVQFLTGKGASFQTVDKAPSCEGTLSTVCLFIVIFSFPNHASYFL